MDKAVYSVELSKDTDEDASDSKPKISTNTESINESNLTYGQITSRAELDNLRAKNAKLENKRRTLQKTIFRISTELEDKEQKLALLNSKLKDSQVSEEVISSEKKKKIMSEVFSPTQIKVLCGQKKANWSRDDMAVAYIIRNISNERCYSYLLKNMNYPLPGLSSIRRWNRKRQNSGKE
ncbi:hypothetical protein JTB14_025878 [Gonioctena quinquepunctata]|nr:hypothetical protein JTB14_025878 [Gonioctena quinquepunctata]